MKVVKTKVIYKGNEETMLIEDIKDSTTTITIGNNIYLIDSEELQNICGEILDIGTEE